MWEIVVCLCFVELVFLNVARRVGCGGGGWLLGFFFSFGPGFGIVISTWLQRSARRAFRAKDERRDSPNNCSEKSNHDSQHAFSGFCFQVSFLRKVFFLGEFRAWANTQARKKRGGGRQQRAFLRGSEGREGVVVAGRWEQIMRRGGDGLNFCTTSLALVVPFCSKFGTVEETREVISKYAKKRERDKKNKV